MEENSDKTKNFLFNCPKAVNVYKTTKIHSDELFFIKKDNKIPAEMT